MKRISELDYLTSDVLRVPFKTLNIANLRYKNLVELRPSLGSSNVQYNWKKKNPII